jgi:hypothetical protein
MSERSDIDRLLRHWFDDGPTSMPDRVVDVVADRISHERQRTAWRLPWRPLDMNPTIKVGAALAAVLVIVVIGWNLLASGSPGVGGPAATSSPSPSPTPTATRSTNPATSAGTWPDARGPLVPGSYVTEVAGVEIALTIPPGANGWEGGDPNFVGVPPFVDPPGGVLLAFNNVTRLMREPCLDHAPLEVEGMEPLVATWSDLPHAKVQGPDEVQFGGFPAVHLRIAIDADVSECIVEAIALYYAGNTLRVVGAGQTIDLWVVDIDGATLVVEASSVPGARVADLGILDEIVDSVTLARIE